MSSTTIKKYKRETYVKIIWCKTICIGKVAWGSNRKVNSIDVETTLVYNKKQCRYTFTTSAEVWNSKRTDVVGGGQCLDEIWERTRVKPFDKVYKWWKLYHLNDMHAGTQEQEQYLKEHKTEVDALYIPGHIGLYEAKCEVLKRAGLYTVKVDGNDYTYGYGWIYYPIPQNDLDDIIEYLEE